MNSGISNLLYWCQLLTWRRPLRWLKERLYDRLEGINTVGRIFHKELGLDEKTSSAYQACDWNDLKNTLRPDTVSPEDVFIDFGSGKGRMLYMAAHSYWFKKVIGVEISEKLNQTARLNIQKNLSKLKCKNVEIITSDVSAYPISDDITVVFLFNPFQGDVFANLVTRLNQSLVRLPRRMRIIYRNPKMHDCLIENGFKVIQKLDDITVYERLGSAI